MEQPCAIPAFCASARETIDAFARRCERVLEEAPRPAGWAPFRVGVARLPHDRAPALVSWLERRCDTTFGAAAIPLDRDRIRRGWFVRYLPDSEREGIPWEVLILDMTDGPLLKEDLPDLVAVLRFAARFCAEPAAVWLLVPPDADPPAVARALQTALEALPA